MGYMKQLADQLAHANTPIKNIRIGKDSLTNTSRGVCYVEMNSVVDAMFLHNQLLGK
jgi:RNA-binding protein 5/10